MNDVFADGISDMTVINGVARLTLVSLEAPREGRDGPDNKPVPVNRQRLVMPLAGLVNLVQQGQALLGRLEQAGVLQRTGAEAKPAVAGPSSPNF